jgi:hypothetical protein
LTTNMIKNLHELYIITIERTKKNTPESAFTRFNNS